MNFQQQAFADEYVACLNASEAARRAGYTGKHIRNTAYKLLQREDIREYVAMKLAQAHVPAEEVIERLGRMARGEIPTKRVVGDREREEYDYKGAAESLGRVYAIFVDKQEIDLQIEGMEIVDKEQAEDTQD